DCPTDTPPFTDTTTNWASTDIACVYGLGIDTGTTATTFSPGDTLTRADMATILAPTIRALL
ncbi:MAG: S-layer homology domain-containing protein, partial [Candidatus Thalassarchaeaceae archaeon]|nr:S-layer homology domain-containing protein [Candidatus Thalassarchaeaceae archaeon]